MQKIVIHKNLKFYTKFLSNKSLDNLYSKVGKHWYSLLKETKNYTELVDMKFSPWGSPGKDWKTVSIQEFGIYVNSCCNCGVYGLKV